MNMSVEEAIEYVENWRSCLVRHQPEKEQAILTLLRVAEGVISLRQYFSDAGMVGFVARIDKFLNPAPKSDIERVREWCKKHSWSGAVTDYVGLKEFYKFLDQLEKETS